MSSINAWDGRSNLPVSHEFTRNTHPRYPFRHSGAVVIAGYGDTLQGDLARVQAARPDLPIIAVNRACEQIKAFAVYSFHFEFEKLGLWQEQQRKRFGDGFTVFAPGKQEWYEHNRRNYPYVDHWSEATASRGSSGWCAVRLAKLLGFAERILCGVPITPAPYADRRPAMFWQSGKTNAVSQFRKAIEADVEHHEGTYSMSGWTQSLLGKPEWIKD